MRYRHTMIDKERPGVARVARWVLSIFAAALGLIGAFSFWIYIEFYWKYRDLFQNGRYFDPDESVVYDEQSAVWGAIAAMFILGSIALLLLAWRPRTRTSTTADE